MQREEKSERSRRQVLEAALELFAHQGYRATTVREIAEAGGVSTGNVYHHFPDKEAIFNTLLDEFWKISETARYPFTRALRSGRFPDNIEQLGIAARDSVREFRPYMALFFVDVIEFDGTHIKRFYSQTPGRFSDLLEKSGGDELARRLRPGVSLQLLHHRAAVQCRRAVRQGDGVGDHRDRRHHPAWNPGAGRRVKGEK